MTSGLRRGANRLRQGFGTALCAALALALGGCISHEGIRPLVELRESTSVVSATSFDRLAELSADWPDVEWWRAFADSQLDTLIDEALSGSPDLEAANARLRQAEAQASLADAEREPTLNARTGVSLVRLPRSVVGSAGGDFSTSGNALLNGSVPFDLWGGRRSAWLAALSEQRAAEVEMEAARLTLAVNVSRAYVALSYAEQSKDIAGNDLARARQLRELVAQRVSAGLDSQTPLKQAEAAQSTAERRLEQAQLAIEVARLQLAALVGKGPDFATQITRPAPIPPSRLSIPADLPASLLGRRPDIVAARWRVQAMSDAVDSARAAFYPNLNLTVFAGLAGRGLSRLLSSDGVFTLLSPALTLPVFDGGRLRARLESETASHDLAVAHYNKVLVGAFNEVAEQLQQLRSLERQLAMQQRTTDAARQAWQLATQRFQRGIGSYLESLTVQQTLFEAEATLAQLQQRQLEASIGLLQALGGGFDSEPTE